MADDDGARRDPLGLRLTGWIMRSRALAAFDRRARRFVGPLFRWVIGPIAVLFALLRTVVAFAAGAVVVGVAFLMGTAALSLFMAYGPFGWLNRDRWF